jgi:hypothetical protein
MRHEVAMALDAGPDAGDRLLASTRLVPRAVRNPDR